MDQFLKKINIVKYIYLIYFLLFVFFIINISYTIPTILFFSKTINDNYIPPKLIYGSDSFTEESIPSIKIVNSTYRGDYKRNGIYQNIIPVTGLKILWKSFTINNIIHGASKASPAIDDSGIYIGGDDGWFYAFNHDGSLKWKYYTFYNHRGIHSTAMLGDDYVWFGSYNGRFYCLDKNNGKIIWSLKLADAIGSSPLFYKGFIYLSVETNFLDGYVVKINAQTGKVTWRSPWLGEQIHSSVTLNPKNKLLYVGVNNGILYAINMDNGYPFWSYSAEKPIKGTALVDIEQDRIYFSGWNKRLTSLHSGTGQVAWETYIGFPSQSSPTDIPTKDVLVLSSHRSEGLMYGIQKSTGKILWKKKITNKNIGIHSGFSAQNKKGNWLYYGTCSKNLFCVLDPLTGKIIGEVKITGDLTGSPVPYKSFIYLSLNDGGLLKLGR